jgi:hypothetical protein
MKITSMLRFAFVTAFALGLLACASSGPAKKSDLDAQTGLDQATTYQLDDTKRKANDNQGSGPLGTQTNPIKADGMEGAKAYLERLRGPGGQKVAYTETGDAGVGPFGSLLYGFEVEYPTRPGPIKGQLFFDIDFAGYKEYRPAAGYTLK